MDSTNGQMVESTSAIGKATLCMNMDFTLGKMVACMKVFIMKIKNMALVFIHGRIRRNMQAGGTMVNNMA